MTPGSRKQLELCPMSKNASVERGWVFVVLFFFFNIKRFHSITKLDLSGN